MEAAVVDTCLVINWSRFSEADRIKRAFHRLYMPELTFSEVKSPRARALAARWLTERYLVLTPIMRVDEEEATKLLAAASRRPEIPPLDPPELYAFAQALRLRVPLLTDNKAPKRVTEYLEEYRWARVYDSLDILILTSTPQELPSVIEKFIRETSFMFSRRRLVALGVQAKGASEALGGRGP